MIPKMNAWILYMHLIDRFLAEIGTFLFQGVAVVSLSLHSPPLWIRVSFMNLLLLYLYSTFYHSIIFFNCQLVQLSFHSAYEHTCTAIIPFCVWAHLYRYHSILRNHFVAFLQTMLYLSYLYLRFAGSTLTFLPLIFACFIASITSDAYSLGTSTKV